MGDHSISELSALAGLPVRTIRYYLAQGLIPSAGREGPATRYPDSTLARLRLIARLRDAHLPLAEIRRRLAELPDSDVVELAPTADAPATPTGSALEYVRSLLGGTAEQTQAFGSLGAPTPLSRRLEPAVPAAPAAPGPDVAKAAPATPPPAAEAAPPTVERSTWERISVAPDIELHVRRPLSRRDNRLVERLLAFARQLQGEDRP